MSFRPDSLALHAANSRRSRPAIRRLFNLRLSHLIAVALGVGLAFALQLSHHPRITVDNADTASPQLIDLNGGMRFGPGSDSLGATLVYDQAGNRVGVYVDDQVPEQGQVIDEEWNQGVPLIIAGIPPGRPHLRYAHALNAQEWYPYNSGYRASNWGPLPRARAYVLQWRFSLQGTPPTRRERLKLLHAAQRRHPVLILGY